MAARKPPPMLERTCTACGNKGHRSDSKECPKRGQSTVCGSCKRRDGTHSDNCRRKADRPAGRPAKPAPASENGFSGKALAAHLRQLHADVERGEAAKEELADIKKALAGL